MLINDLYELCYSNGADVLTSYTSPREQYDPGLRGNRDQSYPRFPSSKAEGSLGGNASRAVPGVLRMPRRHGGECIALSQVWNGRIRDCVFSTGHLCKASRHCFVEVTRIGLIQCAPREECPDYLSITTGVSPRVLNRFLSLAVHTRR